MADLHALIRVRKHAADEKQKILADLYRQYEELEDQKVRLRDTLISEQKKVDSVDTRMLSYFGPYSEAVKNRIESLGEKQQHLTVRIDKARDDVRQAFSDLKKLEITQDRRDEEERLEQNKKESTQLDEIALEIFRRQKD